jgi:hypothetical protein
VVVAALAAAGTTARADDPRDVFGLPTAKPPKDPRDVFGLGPKPPTEQTCDGDIGCAFPDDPLDPLTPYALATELSGTYLRKLPTADADHTSVAGWGQGGGPTIGGPTYGGATGLENRWMIEGAPTDDVATGSAGTRVPLTFLDHVRLVAGGFSARDRASTGGTIDAELLRGTPTHQLDAYVWAGLAAPAADAKVPNDSFYVRRLRLDTPETTSLSIVARGPIAHDVWYAAGIAPSLTVADFTWHASHIVDENGDGFADGAPGRIVTVPIDTTRVTALPYEIPAMVRAGWDDAHQHLALTAIGDASAGTRYFSNSTIQAAGVDHRDFVGDAILDYRARWGDTELHAQAAWHRSTHREAAHDAAAADIPQQLTAYIPTQLADDPVLAAACSAPSTVNLCPVPAGYFASGGAGQLTDTTADRPSATIDLAHTVAHNTLRVGATVEDSKLVTSSRFTGGEIDFHLTPEILDQRTYYAGDCSDDVTTGPCHAIDRSTLTWRTLYAAAYAEDTFQPQPGLDIDGGLRWELMWVGPHLHFSHELAPRGGIAWDILGGGRSKLWASYARTYTMLPAGLGATIISRSPSVDDFTLPQGTGRTHDAGATYSIAEGTAPIAQDEASAGAQFALPHALRFTLWNQYRYVRRGLDTEGVVLTNPIDPPAVRESDVVTAEVASVLPTLTLRAGWSYSWVAGTWTGAYDPRQGAVLYAGYDYNTPDPANMLGLLPQSGGERVYVEGERGFKLGPVDLSVATRLTVASGLPRDVLAYGVDGYVELLPRGAAGRGPMLSQVDLRLAARWRGFDLTLDLFNLFDRTDAVVRDDLYTSAGVRSIVGGSYSDLIWLKDESSGQAAAKSYSFHAPTTSQAPVSAVLGVHKSF